MTNRFCDQEVPCTQLSKAAMMLLSSDYSAKGFEIIVKGAGGKEYRVFFEYCPFCGTRIDPKFLQTIKVRRRR
jgi:hypothetical protein